MLLAGAALMVVLLARAPVALAASGTGSITGSVADASSGQPVPGIDVSTSDASGGHYDTSTDSGGNFTLSGLPAGSYTLTIASGSGQWQQTTQGPVSVYAGQTSNVGPIPVQSIPGNLSGRMTDGSGAPLPGMQVELITGPPPPPGTVTTSDWSAYTDAGGHYTISAIPPGSYTVLVLDGAPDTFGLQSVPMGTVTITGGATTADDLQPPSEVPAGTAAQNASRDLAWINAERVANGLPGGIVLNPRWSADCAAHNAYERANGGVLTHDEYSGNRGYTTGGAWVGGTSILASNISWTPAANPFETAPIHLDQLYSPSLSVVGIDDASGDQCVTTWAGMETTFPSDTVFTYPGNGVGGVPPSENAAEGPYVPGQFVGIPEGTTAGRELFVYLNQAGVMGQANVQFVSATLTGPQGPVAVKTVDNTTPTVGPDLAGGIIIPVKPLAPLSSYTASVTLVNGSGTISHSWSFRTGAAQSSGSGGQPSGCVVPRLRGLSLAKARRALRHSGCRLGKVRRPRHPRRHHALRVKRQSPRAGSRRSAGARVNLVLG